MRTLRYMVLAIIFLIVVVMIIGLFLPSKVRLERSITINRDQATIYTVLNSLANFNKWSPWYKYDPNANYTLSGPESGVGSKIAWQGNKSVGEGSHEIIGSQANQQIDTTFYFGKPDYPVYSSLILTENSTDVTEQKSTVVTWTFENDFGYNVFYRYFSLVLEDSIAPVYDEGLSNLKKYVESLPLYDYSDLSVINTTSQKAYAINVKTSLDQQTISTSIGQAYGKLMTFINQNQISMNGSPQIVSLNLTDDSYEFIAVIPVEKNTTVDETGLIEAYSTYQGRAIKAIHRGSYDNFQKTYDIIDAYAQQNNLQKNGHPWEDFVTDPGSVSTNDLVTDVYQPIK